MADKLRLAIITDIHLGPTRGTKIGERAVGLVSSFVKLINSSDFDMVVDLGDRITDVSPEMDRHHLKAVANLFRELEPPCYHLLGNHDVVHMTREQNADILQVDLTSNYLDTDFMRLVFWQPDVRITNGTGFPSLTHDLRWLEETLSSASKNAVILSHVPVSGHSQRSNYYFHNNFEYSTYPGYERVLEIIARQEKVVAWISGHVHWNTYVNIDGVTMLTIQSLTESFTTDSRPSEAWATVEISSNDIKCQVNGLDPLTIQAPLVNRAISPWLTPMASFKEIFASENT